MFSELLDKSIFGFSVLVPRKLRQNPESSSPRPGPPRLGRPEVAGWCRPAISGSGGRVPPSALSSSSPAPSSSSPAYLRPHRLLPSPRRLPPARRPSVRLLPPPRREPEPQQVLDPLFFLPAGFGSPFLVAYVMPMINSIAAYDASIIF